MKKIKLLKVSKLILKFSKIKFITMNVNPSKTKTYLVPKHPLEEDTPPKQCKLRCGKQRLKP